MRNEPNFSAANVLILGGGSTPLAVVHSLAKASLKSIVVGFDSNDDCRFSRCCDYVRYNNQGSFDAKLAEWLVDRFGGASNTLVLIPACDAGALFIAEYDAILQHHFLHWRNSFDSLRGIVSKDELYASATKAGIAVPPYIASPSLDEFKEWLHRHDPPYIVKPFFVSDPHSPLAQKNISFTDRQAAVDFADQYPLNALIFQQKLTGGDGRIYDCYGLCDVNGQVVALADHLRIRQSREGAGVTSYGEIPVQSAPFPSNDICEYTRRLFAAIRLHGIFGVEWLWDVKTKRLYLIDINARPFSSIGHLCDSGLNLPALAVEELSGSTTLAQTKQLTHTYWIDFSADYRSAYNHIKTGDLTFKRWLGDIVRAKSYARWKLTDPVPALISLARVSADLVKKVVRHLAQKLNP